jgi:inner membrane protein
MTWRTHLVGGLASLALIPTPSSATALALACLFAAIGSLLPDLDARASKLSNTELAGIMPLQPVAHTLNRHLGHRGAFHSLVALLLVGLFVGIPLTLFIDPFAGIGLVLGFASHLLLDACTRSGIPLWWPESTRFYAVPYRFRIATGSVQEDFFFIGLALIAFFYVIQSGHTLPLS